MVAEASVVCGGRVVVGLAVSVAEVEVEVEVVVLGGRVVVA